MTIFADEQKLTTVMEELAAKVRADERERCAKLAETFGQIDPHGPRTCIELAAAIRKGD